MRILSCIVLFLCATVAQACDYGVRARAFFAAPACDSAAVLAAPLYAPPVLLQPQFLFQRQAAYGVPVFQRNIIQRNVVQRQVIQRQIIQRDVVQRQVFRERVVVRSRGLIY